MAAGGVVGDTDLLEGVPTEEYLVPRQKHFAQADNVLARSTMALPVRRERVT